MSNSLTADAALLGPDYALSGAVRFHLDGETIRDIEPLSEPPGTGLFAMPALADAHNHARPLSSTSFGGGGRPLESWLPRLALMPAVDAYTAAAAAFSRSLAGGATSVMVHMVRPMGLVPLADEALQIAQAAKDVGVSIGLAIGLRDRNPLVYGDGAAALAGLAPEDRALAERVWLPPMAPIETQLAAVDDVADAVAALPWVDVQYGPTGVQWCSDALLRAVAQASERTGRRVHMHLLETKPQRVWADSAYPGGLVARLEEIGLLSPRLTLAHCVWARPDDLAQIAASGARVAVNVSSNLHLFSGMAPVSEMLAAGIEVAMGLDGCALDEDDDGLRELRLFHLLHHAPGFETGGLTPRTALRAACATGRAGLGLEPGGVLEPGRPADILLVDLAALDRDALMPIDPGALLLARGTKAMIADIWSRGRQVLRGGEVIGVDADAVHADLRAAYRAALPGTLPLARIWPRVEAGIAAHYRGCC